MIPESFIEELRYRTDITQLIGQYVQLKRAGRNMNGLCPFHSERSPSFTVYQDTQSFYCFGCGAGGDAITFVKRMENLGYVDALKFLAERAGMTLPEDSEDDRVSRLRLRVLELNRATAKYYHNVLMGEGGEAGRTYLMERGLTSKSITRFGLGFAPDQWDGLKNYLTSLGFTLDEMVSATVVKVSAKGHGYDSLRNRVVYPIIDLRGNVIGFGGRALGDEKPKYLNSADSPVFKKSRNLYSMNIAKSTKAGYLLLAEGYMDVIAIVQSGFDNTVATLGTALTGEQARLISQYVEEVVICYDADEAGQKATKRATTLLGEVGVKVRVLTLNGAKDPDEYIKKYGADRFKLLITQSETATEYRLANLSKAYNLDTADGKVEYLKAFCGYMAELSNPIEMEIYLTKTARELSVSKEVLLDNINKIKQSKKRNAQKKEDKSLKIFANNSPLFARDTQRTTLIKYATAEDKVIYILMKSPEYFKKISEQLPPEHFVTTANQKIYSVLYDRLSKGLNIDPMNLSGSLEEESIARLSWIMASNAQHHYGLTELYDFCETIQAYKHIRSKEEVKTMSNEEWVEYMKNLSKGKK